MGRKEIVNSNRYCKDYLNFRITFIKMESILLISHDF